MGDNATTLELTILTHGSAEAIAEFRKMAGVVKEVEKAAANAGKAGGTRGGAMTQFRRDQRIQGSLLGLAGLGGSPLTQAVDKFEYLNLMARMTGQSIGQMALKFAPMAAAAITVGMAFKAWGKEVDTVNANLQKEGYQKLNGWGLFRQTLAGIGGITGPGNKVDPTAMAAKLLRENQKSSLSDRLTEFIKNNPRSGESGWRAYRDHEMAGEMVGDMRRRQLDSVSSWISSDRTAPQMSAGSHGERVAAWRAETESTLRSDLEQTRLQVAKQSDEKLARLEGIAREMLAKMGDVY